MKLIEQKAELLVQPKGIIGVYQQIERAARTCYKSEDKSDGNSMAFVSKLQSMGHNAMLEHGTVYLRTPVDHSSGDYIDFDTKYTQNPYSRLIYESGIAYVTTNYRVLVENNWVDDIQKYLCEPTEYHKKRYTFKIVTSIGIVRELLRHRVFSFANESTRYCNYSKDTFDNEITCIIPHWLSINEETHIDTPRFIDKTCGMVNIVKAGITEPEDIGFISSLLMAEQVYLSMLVGDMRIGRSPQQAREVLPLCTKSELVMTGFEDDWKNFLDVRLKGTTGKPHPDMVILAQMIQDELDKIQNK